jgi:hypothetical protein
MRFTYGMILIAMAMLMELPAADAKPFALKVRGPMLRMGSYDLAFTFSPDGKSLDVSRPAAASSGLQIGVRVRLHRKNALLQEGDTISANSIEELLAKPGLTAGEREELRVYVGLDDRALQSLQSSLSRNSDVTLSELERQAEQVLDQLPVPAYQRPPPVRQLARQPASDDEQVMDFSLER